MINDFDPFEADKAKLPEIDASIFVWLFMWL